MPADKRDAIKREKPARHARSATFATLGAFGRIIGQLDARSQNGRRRFLPNTALRSPCFGGGYGSGAGDGGSSLARIGFRLRMRGENR